jgi:hypothetical protein
MNDSEVIPPSYTLYRNDRADGYGGILLAVKSDITSSEYKKSKNIEFIAANFLLNDFFVLSASNIFTWPIYVTQIEVASNPNSGTFVVIT